MTKLIDITGKALSGEWGTDDLDGTGIRVLRTTNFTNDGVVDYNDVVTRKIAKKNLDSKYLRHGDIIIEKSGGSDKQPVGRVIYFEGPEQTYLFNNFTGLLRVRDRNTWLPRYVFYSLFSNYLMGGTRAYENRTTGLHNLQTDSYISSFEVRPVSIEKQVEICSNLDKIIHMISLKKKQISKLDELVKSRFIEMFGEPENNNKAWPVKSLDKLCTVGSSKRVYQSEQSSEGVPFWRISDLVSKIDTGTVDSALFISEIKYTELKRAGLVPVTGDILVTSRGTLGRCYIIQDEDCFYFQDGMISWLSNYSEEITPLYLQYLFTMSGFRKQIDNTQAGSTVAYLSIAMLKKLQVMVPDKALQEQFAAFVAQTDKSKLAVKQGLEKLETLKKSLMQRYFG